MPLENDFIKQGNISEQTYVFDKPFPLTYVPKQENEFFLANKEQILKEASEYGAVLFKGFDLKCAEEFGSIMAKSGLQEMKYIGGAAVRTLIVGNEQTMNNPQVFTSNESPPSQPIPFHHELAQTPNPPSHISFYCRKNEATGGATPILRSDLVYDYLLQNHKEFILKVEEQGVKYIRIVPEEDDPSSALGRSWKSMFGVKSKEEAEKHMQNDGWQWEWLENGDCKTISKILPAVRVCTNGRKVFFNQVVAAYTGWQDKRNESKKAVVFADNSYMPEDVMQDLEKFMSSNSVAYHWQSGDFVIVDNSVTYHSREPFVGKRSVLASLAKGTKTVNQNFPSLMLQSGDEMPTVGLGLWKISKENCAQTVVEAAKAGYRCFDSACDYGNEVQVGAGLKQIIDEKICTREELFVTSKLWNTYHRKEHVKLACKKTLADLGLEYLDLYLIHFPIATKFVPFEQLYPPEWVIFDPEYPVPCMVEDKVPISETWAAMEELVREGLVKNIGLCNFGVSLIRDLLSYCKIKPAVLQVELHPYNTQQKLIQYCRTQGIQVTAFSCLGASSYYELNMAAPEEQVMDLPLIKDLASKHNRTPAQIVLRWGVQRGTAIIPKSINPQRLKQNISLFDFALSQEEMKSIDQLNKNRRFNDPGHFCQEAFNTFFPIYE